MVLVNGRAGRPQDLEVSQFSVKIVESLLKQHEACSISQGPAISLVPLAFFCSQHRDWHRDSDGNPEEVAMSLSLQLIDRCRDRLDQSVLRKFHTCTKAGNLESVCASLESLIMSLGQDVIVVVILDGLGSFARPPERCEKTRELIT